MSCCPVHRMHSLVDGESNALLRACVYHNTEVTLSCVRVCITTGQHCDVEGAQHDGASADGGWLCCVVCGECGVVCSVVCVVLCVVCCGV